ncbi:unnamed protein product [Cylindrotheca closterium]|uniref:Transmembrane protein n=1 Tax=Cylindrotheca closterium TaxID=2856 RepID=A0AAD2CCT6_9STRA|nr:unnamed protein product [Cylindrotheca closterium]
MSCGQRCGSEFKRPMFDIEENEGSLDINASFHIGKGLLSVVGIIKFITFAIAVVSLVYSFTVIEIPSFYPAFLTPWTVFFGILQLGGSWILTAFYSKDGSIYNPQNKNVLVKITWLLYSVAGVIGCCITILFWGAVYDPDNPSNDMFDKIMTHGGVVAIVLLQGNLLDRVPMRLKHIAFSDGLAVIFSIWLALQNTVIKYNPNIDDDDDAIYDAMKWRTETTSAIIQTVLVIVLVVPLFQTILWAVSLPKRRYLVEEVYDVDKGEVQEKPADQEEGHV